MKVYQKHSNITQNMHGASRNYRYVWDVSCTHQAKFLTSLPEVPCFKIGELNTTLYLCFFTLVSLLYCFYLCLCVLYPIYHKNCLFCSCLSLLLWVPLKILCDFICTPITPAATTTPSY